MTTQTEAKEIRDALRLLEKNENQARNDKLQSDLATAETWYDSLGILTPTTREQSLDVFKIIQNKITGETDKFRRALLTRELNKANEKFKEMKKLG